MKIGYFTERPVRWLPEEVILRNGAHFGVSNKYFDREKAADEYNYWLDENCLAEELGFDSAWLIEHHFKEDGECPSVLLTAAAMAARTSKIRIGTGVCLMPEHDPRTLAQVIATLDLLSGEDKVVTPAAGRDRVEGGAVSGQAWGPGAGWGRSASR